MIVDFYGYLNKPNIFEPYVAAWGVLVQYALVKEKPTFSWNTWDMMILKELWCARGEFVGWSCICVSPVISQQLCVAVMSQDLRLLLFVQL